MGWPTATWFAVALGASLCLSAPAPGGFVLSGTPAVTVHHGHTAILPCLLNPPQSAEGLEVRWYRGEDFDSIVMLYKERKAAAGASYEGRVSLVAKDAASGGLKAGDVSLELVNVTLGDIGDYTCYVSSDQAYDSAKVRLSVKETGSPPLLSPVWTDDNMVNVSCESGGWYPEPSLRWSDQKKQVLTPKSLTYSKDSSGLLSAHSWLLVSSSSEVSCSVGHNSEEAKEARVRLDGPQAETRCGSCTECSECGSPAAGWVAFGLLLIAALAGVGVLLYRKKKVPKKEGHDVTPDGAEEKQELLPKDVQPTDVQLTDVQPTNVQLTDVQPTDVQPTDVQPTNVQLTDVQPTDVQPTDVQPTNVQLTDVQPTDVQPTDVQPTDVQPTDVQPTDVQPTDLSPLKKHYVNVTVDESTNEYLLVRDNKLRERGDVTFPDGLEVTCLTAIKGTPGFSSGQHYWEVSMKRPNADIKKSWWVGVTSGIHSDPSPTASKGFWFLSSSPDTAESFQLSTEPKVLLPALCTPDIIGVFLDHEHGELSFYDAKKQNLIGSLTTEFKGEVFPLFNPGQGDVSPMEILQQPRAEEQPHDVVGSSY